MNTSNSMSSTPVGCRHDSSSPDFSKGAAFVDGMIVPVGSATIPLLDWGFLRSDACQETISVWSGALFRLEDHLDRFQRSVSSLRMNPALGRDDYQRVIVDLVRVTGFPNAYVQIIMTRGFPPIGSRDVRQCLNRFQAFCIPYVWIASPEKQEQGLHLHISSIERVPATSVSPLIKHYHWLDFEMGLLNAYDVGAETVVLSDRDGNVLEGPGFNIFIVSGGTLVTPAEGVLDGMTRRSVLEICEDMQIPTVQSPIRPEMVHEAEEVFITTTAGGVIPITRVDGEPVGSGVPGPMTRRLRELYWQRRSDGWYATPIL